MQLREMDILIHRNGQQYGPYSQQDILKYLNDGSLTQNDLAWYEGAPQWVPLRNIPTLNLVNGAQSILPPPQSVISPFYSTLLSKPFDVNGYIMLAIPTVAAFFIWQADNLGVSAFVFQVLATFSTAILAGMEAKRLGMGSNTDRTPKGKKRSGPGAWTGVILLLWIIGFPAYLFTRSRYGARNLLLPAVLVMILFITLGFIAAPQLPAIDAPEVVALLEKVIRESPSYKIRGFGEGISIETPGEVSYDKSHQKRVGRAILKGKNSSETIYYTVDWQNRSKGIFWVQIQDHP